MKHHILKGDFVMDERNARLIQAQQRAQRLMRTNYFAQAADYLLEKGCFSGATILLDFIDREANDLAD